MAASVTDKFKKVGANTVTTLAAPGKALAAASITVGSTTNYPTDTGIVIAIRVVDTNGELVAGTMTEWRATVTSGTTLAIETTPVLGTDQVYAAGSTTQVYIPTSKNAQNELIDGVLVEHKQTGAHSDVTADSVTVAGVAFRNVLTNAPQGFMINGKIERTVSSNNITVAIKTLAGSNPSATDPVHVRIGDTMRTITAALSVTKNAGTNWFASGGTPFATLEVDYFVYLGYNATDGTVIGFSRIPWATSYGDFSATTTNEKYAAISTITTAASTDVYELVGRFNATLSATASFNWSVPGTSVVISRPIYETRELTWVPTLTNLSGGTQTYAKYVIRMRDVTVRWKYTLAGAGVAGTPRFTLPISTSSDFGATDRLTTSGILFDATGNAWFPNISTVTASAIDIFHENAASNVALISSVAPFTWAVSDAIQLVFVYPAG